MSLRHADDPPLFYECHVFICVNRRPEGHARGSCAARGSEKLRDYMKVRAKELGIGEIRVNASLCLDRCELGPCLVAYPEGIWYHVNTLEGIDRVLAEHVLGGTRVRELMLGS